MIQNDDDESGDEVDFASDDSTVLIASDSTNNVKDRYNFVSITFLLLGLATLLPWCFFTTATDYWMYKFRNASLSIDTTKTELQATFGSWLSIASNFPSFFTLIISTKLTKISEVYRNGISLCAIISLFIVTTAFIYIDTDNHQTAFFIFTMISVSMLNVSGAIFQSGVVGLAAMLPKQFMHKMVTGQAIAGVFAAVAQIVTMLGDESPTFVATSFFLCAVFGLFLTLICYWLVHKTAFFKFHIITSQEQALFSSSGIQQSSNSDLISTFKLLKKVWACALCITMTFTVTIGIFPGLLILVVSSSPVITPWTGRLFLPITCFLLYNAGDLAGRLVSGLIPMESTGPKDPTLSSETHSSRHGRRYDLVLLALSVLRVALLPLLMFCNAHPRTHLPVVFADDRYFIAFVALLGFSNGYLFCSAMMLAPKFVPFWLQERTGTLLTVALGAGLTLGSIVSFPLVKML